jgi:hypothetical protein
VRERWVVSISREDPLALVMPQTDDDREFTMSVLKDLDGADDDELRRAYAHMLVTTFRTAFPARMRLGVGSLSRLADEMRRRGLPAIFWTLEIRDRSDMALHPWLN